MADCVRNQPSGPRPPTRAFTTASQYTIAYMAPFVLGSAVLRPDRCSLFIAVGIISLNNLLIHTPFLADLSERYVPWLGVCRTIVTT